MPPRPRTDTIRFLTLDELGCLLAATHGSVRDRAMFLLAYRHGLRASEVGVLRAEDLDLRTLRLMVHRLKGSHSGAHPLQPDEAKAIRAWLRGREQRRQRDRGNAAAAGCPGRAAAARGDAQLCATAAAA